MVCESLFTMVCKGSALIYRQSKTYSVFKSKSSERLCRAVLPVNIEPRLFNLWEFQGSSVFTIQSMFFLISNGLMFPHAQKLDFSFKLWSGSWSLISIQILTLNKMKTRLFCKIGWIWNGDNKNKRGGIEPGTWSGDTN